MEVAFTLFQKLVSMLIMVGLGYALVRSGLLKSSESRALSMLSLYVVCPVAIMNAFQVEPTKEVMSGLLLAVAFSVLAHAVFLVFTRLIEKPLSLNAIDKAVVIYPNAGIITIPVVTALLGPEWVIYTTAYNAVQLIMLWTHCRILISGEKQIDIKKIILNPNIIAIMVGFVVLFTGLRFPNPVENTIDDIAAMIGPVGMIVNGMIIGGMPIKRVFNRPRVWMVSMLRLFAAPILMVLIAKFSSITNLVPNGETVLLVTLLSIAGPCAATVMQMSQIYRGQEDGEYAGAISTVSLICLAVSMPLVVALYLL